MEVHRDLGYTGIWAVQGFPLVPVGWRSHPADPTDSGSSCPSPQLSEMCFAARLLRGPVLAVSLC